MADLTRRMLLEFRADTGRAVGPIHGLGREAVAAGRRADAASTTVERSSHRMAVAVTTAATGGAIAVAGFLTSATRLGIQFQDSLNSMQAVSHATDEQMRRVAATARALGNDLSLPATSAADAAAAMTELAKGNLSADQAMRAAKGTLQLAAAAQIDGAKAAQIQANALNAFGLDAGRASHVADVLANAANAATGELSDFAYGLQASAAEAHKLRISLDDNVTALAIFANAGIQGSDAGTSLKTALLALEKPTKQSQDALNTLGVKAWDSQGRFVGLRTISEQLAKAQQRLSDKTFAAAVATAFGSDASRAAGVLAAQGVKGWDAMSKAIGRSGGAAEVASARMKGVGGALRGLSSQIETIKIDIFQREAPQLEHFITLLSAKLPGAADAALRGVDTLAAGTRHLIGGVSDIAAKLAPAADAAAGQVDHLGANLDGLRHAGEAATTSLAHLGRDLLPAIQATATAAGWSVSQLATAATGTAQIIGPLVGPIVAVTAAVKAGQLAMLGYASARTAVSSVAAAWGTLSQRASSAASAITGRLVYAMGHDLPTASAQASLAASRTSTFFSRLGATLPVVGAAAVAVGFILERQAQQAEDAKNKLRALFDDMERGGAVAVTASRDLAQLRATIQALEAAGGVQARAGRELAGRLSEVEAESRKAYASLSVLDQAQQRVTKSQNDLAYAIETYGRGSQQAGRASASYRDALARQESIQRRVKEATQTSAAALADYTAQVSDAAQADNSLALAELGVTSSAAQVRDARKAATDAVRAYGASSAQAKDANLALAQSEAALRGQILDAAEAAKRAAISHAGTADKEAAAAAGSKAYRDELAKLTKGLAPGSPLRRYLEGLIRDLDRAAGNRTSTITVRTVTAEGGVSFGPRGRAPEARAGGGPVESGRPYLVGERAPELFWPNSAGTIIPLFSQGIDNPRATSWRNMLVGALSGGSRPAAQTVNVYATTAASPRSIADEVAWAMKTSGR